MNMKVLSFVSVVVFLGFPKAAWAQDQTERPRLPVWKLPSERWPTSTRMRKNAQFRTDHPELYAITEPPAQPVRLYAEHDPVDAVYLTWFPGWEDGFFFEIFDNIATYEPTVTMYMLMDDTTHEQTIRGIISSRGGDPNQATWIHLDAWPHYQAFTLDSIWAVDWGPFWVLDGNGVLASVDPKYNFARVNDDAVPAKLADMMGINDYRPDVMYDGGNLQSDGAGLCLSTWSHVVESIPTMPWDTEQMLAEYLGCLKVIWLDTLHEEWTGHMDMFIRMVDATTIMVGEYDPADDGFNAQVLDENAARIAAETNLNGDPLNVVRIPMPDNANRSVWRTYTNSVIVNDLVLVPVYAQESSHEAEALTVYQNAMPGKTVVPIDSDGIIQSGGAIHCVTRTRPAASHTRMEPTVDYRCSGAWYCVDGCGELDFAGLCVGPVQVYCDNGQVVQEDCRDTGEVCGWDAANDYVNCVSAGCGAVTAEGECRTVGGAEFAIWCENNYPLVQRCPPGVGCAVNAVSGHVECQGCMDECQAGEQGCSADRTRSWICAEAGDGDDCLERVFTDCSANARCENGECVTLCEDECRAGETGCGPGSNEWWTCGEADDGDACLETVSELCPADHTCSDGTCVYETPMPGPGRCGCNINPTKSGEGAGAGWVLLLLLFGFAILFRRRRPGSKSGS